MLTMVKRWLFKKFSMKDLEKASYILGIKIYRDRSKWMLDLSQKLYIEKMLKRFSMKNFKRGLLPLRHGIHLSKMICLTTFEEIQCMSRIPYASVIGSLMYAMLCTRSVLPLLWVSRSGISRIQMRSTGQLWRAFLSTWERLRICSWSLDWILSSELRVYSCSIY